MLAPLETKFAVTIEYRQRQIDSRFYWIVQSNAGTQCYNTLESALEYLKTLLPFLEASWRIK